MAEKIIFTIGHSTHTAAEFIDMLKSFGIEIVADIRGLPGSNRYPWFNKESLEQSLPAAGIGYAHLKDLGGRRKARKDSKNTAWRNESFRGYADYMETKEFKGAILALEKISEEKRTAIMCAESLWWRCHRSLVSDYLKLKGWNVYHIMGEGKSTKHNYREPARIVSGKLTYEKAV